MTKQVRFFKGYSHGQFRVTLVSNFEGHFWTPRLEHESNFLLGHESNFYICVFHLFGGAKNSIEIGVSEDYVQNLVFLGTTQKP